MVRIQLEEIKSKRIKVSDKRVSINITHNETKNTNYILANPEERNPIQKRMYSVSGIPGEIDAF